MISCIIFALGILFLAYGSGFITGKPKYSKEKMQGYSAGMAVCLLVYVITIIATSRMYDAERFSTSFPAKECTIRETKGKTIVTHNADMFVLPTENVVLYDAPDKESETVEIYGERRTYSPAVIKDIYRMYYLREPMDETTILTFTVNRSVYNPMKDANDSTDNLE